MQQLPRPVRVLHDGRWVTGTLYEARREDGRWKGFVRYTVDVGMGYVQWRWEDELRPQA